MEQCLQGLSALLLRHSTLRSLHCGPHSLFIEVPLAAKEYDEFLCSRLPPLKSVMRSNLGFEKYLPDSIQVWWRFEIRILLGYALDSAILSQELKRCLGTDSIESVWIEISAYQYSEIYQLLFR